MDISTYTIKSFILIFNNTILLFKIFEKEFTFFNITLSCVLRVVMLTL